MPVLWDTTWSDKWCRLTSLCYRQIHPWQKAEGIFAYINNITQNHDKSWPTSSTQQGNTSSHWTERRVPLVPKNWKFWVIKSLTDCWSLIPKCHKQSESPIDRFCKLPTGNLIKAITLFEKLNIYFIEPLSSTSKNRFLMIMNEYSAFLSSYAFYDSQASTLIRQLNNPFSTFSIPFYIHSDRGSSFMFEELINCLCINNIVSSNTTAWNPQLNGQFERLKGTL